MHDLALKEMEIGVRSFGQRSQITDKGSALREDVFDYPAAQKLPIRSKKRENNGFKSDKEEDREQNAVR